METTQQFPSTELSNQPTISIAKLFCFAINSGELLWGGAVNSYLLLHLICIDCFPMLAQSNHAAPWILLASVIAVVASIVFRSPWQLKVWLLPGAAMFIIWYGQNWLPVTAHDAEGVEITVATFNVYGQRGFQNLETLEVIKSLEADIVGMQEVSFNFASQLNTDLHEQYPYQLTRLSRDNEFALISRYPILDHEFHEEDFDRDNDRSLPGYLRAIIDVDGQPLIVYVIHPPNPEMDPFIVYDDRDLDDQVTFIADLVEQEVGPTLVFCDCNSSPRSRQYELLDSILDNAFAEQGWGFGMTFPSSFPVIRIDHIWYSPDFMPLEVKVWSDSGSSDHRPLWARLDLRGRN